MLELARLWIHPRVQSRVVKDAQGSHHASCVASSAIAKALRRVRQDWHGKYPHLPAVTAVVAWSDDTLHRGTVYRATNFREVGLTAPSRPSKASSRRYHADYGHPKRAFLYEFNKPLSQRELERSARRWQSAPTNLKARRRASR